MFVSNVVVLPFSLFFFYVEEALAAVLDGLEGDDSGDEHGASATVAGPLSRSSSVTRSRSGQRETDRNDGDDGSEEDDWEDPDKLGAKAVRDFFIDSDSSRSGSDSGDSSASSDDDEGGEKELSEEALVMRKGCGCKNVNHFQSLSIVDVQSHNLSCLELERGELDGVILGRLAAGSISDKATARGKERRRDRYSYTFSGQKVCNRVFAYVHAIGKERMENLQKHYQTKGIEPRVHGNKGRRPRHSLMYEQVEHVVRFLERHSESWASLTCSTSWSSRHTTNLPSDITQQESSVCAIQRSMLFGWKEGSRAV